MVRWGYWEYYKPAKPKAVKNGIKAKSKRGEIGATWWSKRWIAVLESFSMGTRLTRGRSYARKGQVISIDVREGIVKSKVQGSGSRPYSVTIKIDPISNSDWEKAADVMASKAIFAAKLLAGEMPADIEDAFAEAGISLFPVKLKDIETDCSCPDWANPCKHIAAVYYLLAERFDEDPFLLFKLRGRTKEDIIDALLKRRVSGASAEGVEAGEGEAVKPLDECMDSFWDAGDALDSFSVNPSRPEVEAAVLRRLGDAPFFISKYNIAALLSRGYAVAGVAALQRASGETEERGEGL
ncbi:MAG: SWIM zinc finger family protein [Euryarchaeota archaeon]|nr:SWIM zinc finger family protein [Euryarchaeota archaeon]